MENKHTPSSLLMALVEAEQYVQNKWEALRSQEWKRVLAGGGLSTAGPFPEMHSFLAFWGGSNLAQWWEQLDWDLINTQEDCAQRAVGL